MYPILKFLLIRYDLSVEKASTGIAKSRLLQIFGTLFCLTILNTSISSADTNSVKFERIEGPLSISIVVENTEGASKEITDGSKINVRGVCSVNTSALPKSRTFTNNRGSSTYTVDPNWRLYCNAQIKQLDKYGRTFTWDLESKEIKVDANGGKLDSITFIEKTYVLVSGEPLRASLQLSADSENEDYGYVSDTVNWLTDDVVILTPSIKSKTSKNKNSPTGIDVSTQTLDGEEISDDAEPTLRVIKNKSNGYLVTLEGFEPEKDVSLIAKKKGSKSFKFNVVTSESGDLKFQTSRNLKGFKMSAIVDGEVILLTSIR
jgi:hypothetical protein